VLVVLGVIAVAGMVSLLGRSNAQTLKTADGSAVAIDSHRSEVNDAASTTAEPNADTQASRSERRKPLSSSPTAAAPLPKASDSASPSPSASDDTSEADDDATPGSALDTDAVVTLVNTARATAGCDPVHEDPRLDAAALAHSEDEIARDYFSHTTPDGVSPWDRAEAAGYDVPTGENIAQGQPDAASVMDAWMESEGHRANILNCGSKAIGVGLALDSEGTSYWTQMFGAE
jgi:uncharacterized protein YkwD